MRTILIAALLGATNIFLPCARAQQSEADRQAMAQLRAKAEGGDAQAQCELGQLFAFGQFGVATNHMEAVKWYRKAAEQNHPAAQCNLGVCYERGDGVPKYEMEAYKCYLLAAAQGDNKAKRNASMLQLMLSREEIVEGKRRANAWLDQRKTNAPITR